MNTAKLLTKTGSFLKHQSPTILTCIGAMGVIGTAVLAVKATPKALRLIEEEADRNPEELTNLDIVAVSWKCYIPAFLVASATIACIFGANALNQKQQATLASAYMLLDQSYKEYRNKVKELYGEEADRSVREAIAKEKLEQSKIMASEDKFKCLFYEPYYGQVFERSMLEVQDAEYKLNQKFAMEGEASLNDFFELLSLPKTPTGEVLGWSQDVSFDFYNYNWIGFKHELIRNDDGLEYYAIRMEVPPIYGYDVPF